MAETEPAAAHVLIFPFPIQGHLNSMLPLAKLLSSAAAGLHVTFLHTDHNLRRLLKTTAKSPAADTPKLRFLSISDGLTDAVSRSGADSFLPLAESLETKSKPLLRSLLLELKDNNGGADEFPPLTCVISDWIMPFAIDTAEELGIPAMAFRTASACSLWVYLCIPQLIQHGEIPIPEGADMDGIVRGVPGMETFLRRRDLPSPCIKARDMSDPMLQLVSTATAHCKGARALILNSMDSLESTALAHIRAHIPITFAMGPMHAMLRTHNEKNNGHVSDYGAISLSHEDRTCMTWLDSQPDNSVVYVSYGSLIVISWDELLEFWAGLVNSSQRFLWVLRSDLIDEKEWTDRMDSLPEEVRRGTEERGWIVSWAPQQEVLAHRAVGCFLTHSGWNSTLESIMEGVPMICWPFFADQQINSRFVSEVWRIGLDMKDVCERGVVERMLRAAMEGERATVLREKAREMAESVKKSIAGGGSSFMNFQRLVQYIKSLSCNE